VVREARVGRKAWILLTLSAALVACMAPKRTADLIPERALPLSTATPLGKLVAEEDPPGETASGFSVLDTSRSAYLARMDLVELAEKSLDLQYFIWNDDLTGRIFIDRVARAAQRGVRVRILLDDLPGADKDTMFRALASKPNVEVRIFNPFGVRRMPRTRRWVEFLARFDTLNHRMHNKLLVADGALAVIGGRNIGDPYFGVARKGYNHRDFDLLCAGPIVGDMARNFDEFWNSGLAFPVESLHEEPLSDEYIEQIWWRLEHKVASSPVPAYLQRPPATPDEREKALLADLVWAAGTLVADGPEKVSGSDGHLLFDAIRDFGRQAHHEIVVVSPYYADLDKEETRAALEEIAKEGLSVRMLVNSLAAIDGVWSDAGYARARPDLLRHGVELYESRPDAACRSIHTDMRDPRIRLVLHSKVAVADGHLVFAGTPNLDPRSIRWNTEAGVLVDSPELAARVLKAIELDFQLENSWRVELGPKSKIEKPPPHAPDDLVWISQSGNGTVRLHHEPSVTLGRRLALLFFGLFPIDPLL